jgi:hypothetical protein
VARRGKDLSYTYGLAGRGAAGSGLAWHGEAWLSGARHGILQHTPDLSRRGMMRRGVAGQGIYRTTKARLGVVRRRSVWRGQARFNAAGQGGVGHGLLFLKKG